MGEEQKSRLQNVLKDIGNTLVANAEGDFNESMKGLDKSNAKPDQKYDPRDLKGQIANYEDFYDRLKFLFLEQEAKEKFLRMVLEPSPTSVEKQDIVNATKDRDTMIESVKAKNEQIGKLTDEIRAAIEKNVSNYEEVQEAGIRVVEKLESLKERSEKLAQLKGKVESFRNSDSSLPKLQELLGKSPNVSPDELLLNSTDGMQRLIDKHLGHIHDLQQKINKAEIELTEQERRISDEKLKYSRLVERDLELTKQIETIKESLKGENNSTPETLKLKADEEKLKVLMKVWLDITNIEEFKLDDTDGSLKFKFKDFPENECLIFINKSHKLERISYAPLEQNILKELVNRANKTKDALSYAVEHLYKMLKD